MLRGWQQHVSSMVYSRWASGTADLSTVCAVLHALPNRRRPPIDRRLWCAHMLSCCYCARFNTPQIQNSPDFRRKLSECTGLRQATILYSRSNTVRTVTADNTIHCLQCGGLFHPRLKPVQNDIAVFVMTKSDQIDLAVYPLKVTSRPGLPSLVLFRNTCR